MNLLNFTFKDGDDTLYSLDVPYKKEETYFIFSVEKENFKIKLDGDLHIIKENEESIFEIIERENYLKSLYSLKKTEVTLDMEILSLEYKCEDGEYTIKYTLSSDEERDKCIILKIV